LPTFLWQGRPEGSPLGGQRKVGAAPHRGNANKPEAKQGKANHPRKQQQTTNSNNKQKNQNQKLKHMS
jgi:hypothetical protein